MAFLDNFPPKGMNLGVDDGIYWALFQNANSIAVRQEFMVATWGGYQTGSDNPLHRLVQVWHV